MTDAPADSRRRRLPLFLAAAGVLLSLWPALGAGMLRGHDLFFEVLRADQYRRALVGGQFPPRWAADLDGGFGYPIFNFFPPLPLAGLASAFALLRDWMAAAEAWVAVCAVVAAFGMARWLREHVGATAAAAAGAIFALAPYRVWNAFGRDAFAELTALSLAPWVFAELARVTDEDKRRGAVAGAAVAGALFALSHNLSVIMFAPVAIGYVLPRLRRAGRPAVSRLAAAGGLAVALSAFYTFPAVLELRHVGMEWSATGRFGVIDNALTWEVVHNSPWPGVLAWLVGVLVVALTLSLASRSPGAAAARWVVAWSVVAAIWTALAFRLTSPLWERATALYMFQFPWRVFGPASFALAAAVGGALSALTERRAAVLGTLLVAASAVASAAVVPWDAPRVVFAAEDTGGSPTIDVVPEGLLEPAAVRGVLFANTTVADEFLPRAVRRKPTREDWVRGRLAAHGPARIESVDAPAGRWSYAVSLERDTELEWLAYDFPGWWEVRVDDEALTPSLTERGTPIWPVNAGEHRVTVRLRQSVIERMSNGLSSLALLALGVLVAWDCRGLRRRK